MIKINNKRYRMMIIDETVKDIFNTDEGGLNKMGKERRTICGWCGQALSRGRLLVHLEECHKDFQHKRK